MFGTQKYYLCMAYEFQIINVCVFCNVCVWVIWRKHQNISSQPWCSLITILRHLNISLCAFFQALLSAVLRCVFPAVNQPAHLFPLSPWHSFVLSQCWGAQSSGLKRPGRLNCRNSLATAVPSATAFKVVPAQQWQHHVRCIGFSSYETPDAHECEREEVAGRQWVAHAPSLLSLLWQGWKPLAEGPEQSAGGGNNQKELGRNLLEPLEARGAWCFNTCKGVFCKSGNFCTFCQER